MSTNVGDGKVAAENVRRLRVPHRLATAQLAAAMVEAGRAHWLSGSGTAAIHVCDAACLCGGRCSETQALRDLIARSSLGSPEAAALRESIPPELAELTLRRAAEMERDALASRIASATNVLDGWGGCIDPDDPERELIDGIRDALSTDPKEESL